MVSFSGPPKSATRNKPISAELKSVLETAAESAGIDAIYITSGGQDALGEGPRRTGSTRHDRGRAADLQCSVGGRVLTFTNSKADPAILAFVTAAAAAGATGIGAATDYMGDRTIHVGFGTSVSDKNKLVWGKNGKSAKAPIWLRDAAEAGWSKPSALSPEISQPLFTDPGSYTVIARSGLRLRGGPGTDFDIIKLLPLGTQVEVLAIDPKDTSWARVDLQGDGISDGYVHVSFLAPVGSDMTGEHAPEPDDGDNG